MKKDYGSVSKGDTKLEDRNAVLLFCCFSQVGFVHMVMFGMMIYTMHGYWPLNFALCTVLQVFDFGMCSVSILHLCLIAFDRLVPGVKPF